MKRIFGFVKRRWFLTLVGGIALFIASELGLTITGNPNFVPAVLLVGAFTVPVTFVTYFSERERAIDKEIQHELPLSVLITCFLVGGILGVAAAGIVEYETLKSLNVPGLFGVGLIEESAKLILPIVLYVGSRYQSEADGLLFGVTSGMGFAALETMGYGLVALIKSQGNVVALEEVFLVRGLFSPASHAAWTGLVCSVLWRERVRRGHRVLNLAVVVAFITAVVLHALWDIVSSLGGTAAAQLIIALFGNIVIAVVSLTLLFRRLRESTRWQRQLAK